MRVDWLRGPPEGEHPDRTGGTRARSTSLGVRDREHVGVQLVLVLVLVLVPDERARGPEPNHLITEWNELWGAAIVGRSSTPTLRVGGSGSLVT